MPWFRTSESAGCALDASAVLSPAARALDVVLEASVVGSFSKVGPALRRRSAHWDEPRAAVCRVIVVTGATSGLGLAAATELSRLGAHVCIVGRDRRRTEDARRRIEVAARAAVTSEVADFLDLDQVVDLADRLGDRLGRIDGLVHNAGALFRSRQTSPQGIEATVTLHVLAPYILTERLRPILARSPAARVITMTSGGMYTQRFELGNLVAADDGYDGVIAYARAKRAQVVLTQEWQRRHGPSGVDFHVVHPGWADTPGLAAGLPTFARALHPLLRSASEGVDTIVWLAGSPAGTPTGGGLWLDRRRRGEYYLPWTWVPRSRRAIDGVQLWEWCRDHLEPSRRRR
jgi:NAD(P)-dependent dehydrogenase (short-subunit alcohol dehydrogenase family)